MSVAIKIENLSKQYRLGLVSTRTLSHDLNRWWNMNIQGKDDPYLKIGEGSKALGSKGAREQGSEGKRFSASSRLSVDNYNDYIWALRDINLEVHQGEVLGIISKNGAGKSTLLKILSKVTAPTTGSIKANGRIASLLEVGTGFHPEMTGRENIYMNGAIMGMSKAEITRKLDEIIDFAGVEPFIDTPVKRYSSGMTVRLGFAVAAHLEPEILVVDEVLAAGDAEFQKKAIGKMQDISLEQGRTVLFVSHNMASVKKLCVSGILLENGSIIEYGEISFVIDKYLQNEEEKSEVFYPENNIVKEICAFQIKDKIILKLRYQSDKPIKQPNFGFILYDNFDNPIFGTNPLKYGVNDFGKPKNFGEVYAVITSPYLFNGNYPISIWFNDGIAIDKHIFYKEKCILLKISSMNKSYIQKELQLGPVIPLIDFRFS